MASQSKNSKSPGKKRSSSLKRTVGKTPKANLKRVKKVGKRGKKQPSLQKKLIILLLLLLTGVALIAIGYYVGKNGGKSQPRIIQKSAVDIFSTIKTKTPPKKRVASVEHHPPLLQKSIIQKKHTSATKTSQRIEKKKSVKILLKAKHPISKNRFHTKSKLVYHSGKPKLVIVIDDISSAKQLKRIKALGIPVTPSIFPPSALSMTSHRLARGLKHYMIHLPMESGSRQFNHQYKTLKISFSKEKMQARIKEIRRLFPAARYINNHTGSVFTSNMKAMRMLYGIMKKEGFIFIDSRTIGTTKVKKIAHAYGDTYVGRDVFIDNIHTVVSIHQQLRKAVQIAKRKGYAIAIGHPHTVTMQALASAKAILSDVKLVYIDQIFQKQ